MGPNDAFIKWQTVLTPVTGVSIGGYMQQIVASDQATLLSKNHLEYFYSLLHIYKTHPQLPVILWPCYVITYLTWVFSLIN